MVEISLVIHMSCDRIADRVDLILQIFQFIQQRTGEPSGQSTVVPVVFRIIEVGHVVQEASNNYLLDIPSFRFGQLPANVGYSQCVQPAVFGIDIRPVTLGSYFKEVVAHMVCYAFDPVFKLHRVTPK